MTTAFPAGDGHEERDPRAVGAGWLRPYSKNVAGWASGGIGRVKKKESDYDNEANHCRPA